MTGPQARRARSLRGHRARRGGVRRRSLAYWRCSRRAEGDQRIDAQAPLDPGVRRRTRTWSSRAESAPTNRPAARRRPYLEIAQWARDPQHGAGPRPLPTSSSCGSARRGVARLVRAGVTTVEVKTGYGLSVEQELRLLRIVRRAGRRAGCEVSATLLGLHAVPPSWTASSGSGRCPGADAGGRSPGRPRCDAFLEKGAFDAHECRAALEAGAHAGLVPHLHADHSVHRAAPNSPRSWSARAPIISTDHAGWNRGAGPRRDRGRAPAPPPWFLRDPRPAQANLARRRRDRPRSVATSTREASGSRACRCLLAAGCLIAGLTPASPSGRAPPAGSGAAPGRPRGHQDGRASRPGFVRDEGFRPPALTRGRRARAARGARRRHRPRRTRQALSCS